MGIYDRDYLERWLRTRPREYALIIGARIALRVAPMLAIAIARPNADFERARRELILPTFRRIAEAWFVSAGPSREDFGSLEKSYYSSQGPSDSSSLAADAAIEAANATSVFSDPFSFVANSAVFATRAIGAAHAQNIWTAISEDATELDRNDSLKISARDLAIQVLWPTGTPSWVGSYWKSLERKLLEVDEGWEVWTTWYDARLNGAGYMLPNLEIEAGRVGIPETIWNQSPRVINDHIKRVIETIERRSKISDVASANDNDGAPNIPPQRRAAVEPVWQKGQLTLPRKKATLSLNKKKFAAALSALRAELLELADDVFAEDNIDKRPAKFLSRLANRIPGAPLTQEELFRLAHTESVFNAFAATVAEEWPSFLAVRYQALSLQFDRTMRQSPLWREFLQNAAKQTLSPEQISNSKSLGEIAATALQEEEALDFVDKRIPTSLIELAGVLSVAQSGGDAQLGVVEDGSELLAADLVESVNNVLKPIAEVALAAGGEYGKQFGKGFKNEAKRQGLKDGEKAFKWLRRLVIVGAGGAVGTGSFSALSNLLAKYPDAFSWLGHVLRFLK